LYNGGVCIIREANNKKSKERKEPAWGGCTNVPPSLACSPLSRLLWKSTQVSVLYKLDFSNGFLRKARDFIVGTKFAAHDYIKVVRSCTLNQGEEDGQENFIKQNKEMLEQSDRRRSRQRDIRCY
jgi:hypothetical protein